MKFGFIQRLDQKGESHKLIGTFTVETKAFLAQMNISLSNSWATLRDVISSVFERKEQ